MPATKKTHVRYMILFLLFVVTTLNYADRATISIAGASLQKALGIDAETLLSITLVEDHLEVTPLRQSEDALRRYTEEDIARFLEEDKLDEETARRVRELVRRGEL